MSTSVKITRRIRILLTFKGIFAVFGWRSAGNFDCEKSTRFRLHGVARWNIFCPVILSMTTCIESVVSLTNRQWNLTENCIETLAFFSLLSVIVNDIITSSRLLEYYSVLSSETQEGKKQLLWKLRPSKSEYIVITYLNCSGKKCFSLVVEQIRKSEISVYRYQLERNRMFSYTGKQTCPRAVCIIH